MRFTGTGIASTDELALIEGIRANPDEDTPRLVYADWLEENGTDDRDVATAQFIRLSCLMQKANAKVVPWAARVWLGKSTPNTGGSGKHDFNFARLIPALSLHIDAMNRRADEPDLTGEAVGFPKMLWKMDGRWLRLRFFGARPFIAQCLDIEFVRGFVNRVVIRYPHQIDNVLPLLAWDQPIFEPQLYKLAGPHQSSPHANSLYSYQLSNAAVGKVIYILPADIRPDGFSNFGSHTRFWWTGTRRSQRRAAAVAQAIRLAALDVVTGLRKPMISQPWPNYTLPVLP